VAAAFFAQVAGKATWQVLVYEIDPGRRDVPPEMTVQWPAADSTDTMLR
jgi:hypothetical protein